MNIEIKQVTVDEKEILRNLLEKYNYEFSQWSKRDVNPLGLYGYDYLDCYWTEKNRWAYFILVNNQLAGFAMVNDYPETNEITDYSLAEFFVMLKYRRNGVGRQVAHLLFDRFHGSWQLKRHPHNIPSMLFWNTIVSEYTNGNYRVVDAYPNTEFEDGTPGNFLFFNT